MTIGAEWRDPAGYAGLHATGRAGLAWELLRRDPAYQAAGSSCGEAQGANMGPVALEAAHTDDVARWGLHFRGE